MESPDLLITETTSGYSEEKNWHAMLVGMTFPASGCWKITGSYRGSSLELVVEVG